jgi:hypothetical protein
MTLDDFYEQLVRDLKALGVACAITSGRACVEFGVATSTEDCDILCSPDGAGSLLELLKTRLWQDKPANYRGRLSPPLESRWLRGGYTSYFEWKSEPVGGYLDVFGHAPRVSSNWQAEVEGLFASRFTVAEMKLTNRTKDWPQATALGIQLLRRGDHRGWLYIYDLDTLLELAREASIPDGLIDRRPVLRLVAQDSPLLRRALLTELEYWSELDRARLRIYQAALRPYARSLDKTELARSNVLEQHRIRVREAERCLIPNPLLEYGLERYLAEVRSTVVSGLDLQVIEYLPDVRANLQNVVA